MAFICKSLKKYKFLKKKKQVKNKCFVKKLISISQAISQTRCHDPAFGVDPPKPRVMTRGLRRRKGSKVEIITRSQILLKNTDPMGEVCSVALYFLLITSFRTMGHDPWLDFVEGY